MRPPFFSPANRLWRAAISLVSGALASALVCTVVIFANYEAFSRSITSWLVFFRGSALVVVLAWLVSLPLVLFIEHVSRWRLGLLLLGGTLLGPTLLLVADFAYRYVDPLLQTSVAESWKVELVVTSISLLASVLYFTFLRMSARSHRSVDESPVPG